MVQTKYAAMRLLLAAVAVGAARGAPSLSCGGGGICLSGTVNHNAILQRAPARAAVVGSVNAGSPAGAAVSLELAGTLADGSAYSKLFSTTATADFTFKVLLDAMPAWGSFAVTASCATCAGAPTSVRLSGITFGDVFVASGENRRDRLTQRSGSAASSTASSHQIPAARP